MQSTLIFCPTQFPLSVGAGVTSQVSLVLPTAFRYLGKVHLNYTQNVFVTIRENSSNIQLFGMDSPNCPLDGAIINWELAVVREYIVTITNNSAGTLSVAPSFTLCNSPIIEGQ